MIVDSLINAAGNIATTVMQNRNDRRAYEEWKDYNSPSSQMDRFRKAGLNPSLMYGQVNNATGQPPSDRALPMPKDVISDVMQGLQAIANLRATNTSTDGNQIQNDLHQEQRFEQFMDNIEQHNRIANGMGIQMDVPSYAAPFNYSITPQTEAYNAQTQALRALPLNEHARKAVFDNSRITLGYGNLNQRERQMTQNLNLSTQRMQMERDLAANRLAMERRRLDAEVRLKERSISEQERHNQSTESSQKELINLKTMRDAADIQLKKQIFDDRSNFPLWKTRKREFKWMPFKNLMGTGAGGDALDAATKYGMYFLR